MADDLEAFLQRAAQKRKKRPPAQIVVLEPKTAEPIVVAEPVPLASELASIGAEAVASHVERHLDNQPFESRANQLGERVGLADDMLEDHLKQVFEHRLGTLRDELPVEAAEVLERPMAEEVLDMFRSTANLRRAVLLNEILTPPDHRW